VSSPRICGADLFEVDLPFHRAFRHAAAARDTSSSLFLRVMTDDGQVGFGEALPRSYVTGEARETAFDLLATRVLPRLLGATFASLTQLHQFLASCDGRAPADWVEPAVPQVAAWTAVDLALLDVFGRAFAVELRRGLEGERGTASVPLDEAPWPRGLRYSLVLSGDGGTRSIISLLKARVYGLDDVKVKVDRDSEAGVRLARRVLGQHARIRVDSNMAWSRAHARAAMPRLARQGVESFEQPLAADDLEGLARLRAETGLAVVADESFHDRSSLDRLIAAGACGAVNVRIAKCGGLVAAVARCREALAAGLRLHIGCLVGETSQLSAAQLILVRTLGGGIDHLEGCFGERLLRTDPVRPRLQFRRGGLPPASPPGPGFGTAVDMDAILRHCGRRAAFGQPIPTVTAGGPAIGQKARQEHA